MTISPKPIDVGTLSTRRCLTYTTLHSVLSQRNISLQNNHVSGRSSFANSANLVPAVFRHASNSRLGLTIRADGNCDYCHIGRDSRAT